MGSIPRVISLSSASNVSIPVMGLGTSVPGFAGSDAMKEAILIAMELGYRHFDTAALYQSEGSLGEAIAEALHQGLIKSRDDLFITSKLWCCDAHSDRVLPALQTSLRNLGLDYLDLYLIHWPVSSKEPGEYDFAMKEGNLVPMEFKSVWEAMEECQRLGLAKSIGVSNFSCKKLSDLLSVVKRPPAVNQVEMNVLWQQKKLRDFCATKGIQIAAYSPLGAKGTPWGGNSVMENEVLKEIADARGKTVAQVALRWAFEQGVVVVVKSFNKERMKENLEIFDWELTDEETQKISKIPQRKGLPGIEFLSDDGPFKSLDELWDGEIR